MWIALLALALRVCVFAAASWRLGLSTEGYANLYDGRSYLITARAIADDRRNFDDYQGRVFPGYPAMIAVLHLVRIPWHIAALGLDWIAAIAAAAMSAMLFGDRRIGLAMATLIPHYLMNSTLAASEAPMLALTVGGLLAAKSKCASDEKMAGDLAGGVLLGLAGLVRPVACFAVLGYAASREKTPKWKIAVLPAAAGIVVILALIGIHTWRGDPLANVRTQIESPGAYNGQLFTWPFHSLIVTPFEHAVPWPRIVYIWLHVILTLAGCILGLPLLLGDSTPLDRLAAVWLLANTAFVLCLGNVWGFECFHRFTVPALPALFWIIRQGLPKGIGVWVVIGGASACIAALSVGR